jgi:5-carboxyvanillate decarboxylase
MNYRPQLRMTLEVLGPDRILYAGDYPFEDQAKAVEFIEAMPLSVAQKTTLFQDNAARVFGL